MFDIGQKIVCINDTFEATIRRIYQALPQKGKTYTVRECDIGRRQVTSPGEGANKNVQLTYLVRLYELRNPADPYMGDLGDELGFDASRFVPLEELTEEERLALSQPLEVTKPLYV
jgi:hypothetical protein